MIIGNFKRDTNGYAGELVTLTTNLSLRFVPVEKASAKEPDFRVTTRTTLGDAEVGAAWKRKSEKGVAFLSVTLQDPMLTHPINAALFDGDDEAATLVWSRPPKSKKAE